MKIVEDAAILASVVQHWRNSGYTVGLVPTMGWYHEGHLALMRASLSKADKTITSLFVNPRQFGKNEDLDRYPRNLERDAHLAEEAGVDVIFTPTVETMYPTGYQTNISLQHLAKGLCGESRPGHFDGVATIVTKLFNLVQPDFAVFGEKDYQQLTLIRQMVKDLNYDIEIIGHPIVREKDGLAMSSRNYNLNAEERKHAPCLFETLQHARKRVGEGNTLPSVTLIQELQDIIAKTYFFEIDYIAIVDKKTLVAVESATSGNILALAVYSKDNRVRLIDNTEL